MNNHLVNISRRQVKGRWMDRGFLLVLAVFVVLAVSSVAMAVNAASTPAAKVELA
jgi:hypothetical protein